nr:unnamed protein product [Digitaria exilis]
MFPVRKVPNHRPLTCRNTSQASFRLMYHFVPFPVQGTWLCTAFPVTGVWTPLTPCPRIPGYLDQPVRTPACWWVQDPRNGAQRQIQLASPRLIAAGASYVGPEPQVPPRSITRPREKGRIPSAATYESRRRLRPCPWIPVSCPLIVCPGARIHDPIGRAAFPSVGSCECMAGTRKPSPTGF